MVENRRYGNRIKDYYYSESGWYFVTMCIFGKKVWFGKIVDGKMLLNEYGEIAKKCWLDLPNHYGRISLDEWIIMPNHVHGIITIDNDVVGTGLKPVPTGKRYSLSEVIRGFKTFSSRRINETDPFGKFRWQRSFFDYIIRNEKILHNISRYIQNNPLSWSIDRENPKNIRKTNESS
jgi:REP-associated tyrosine transposase